MTDESIKLVLADDQALVRGALVALLSLEPDIEVVGQSVEKTRPDVLLLDIEMPGMDGIEVADRLAGADVKILIVTTFGRPGYLRRAMDAGAAGFVVKDTPASELAQAVRRVHQGGRVIDPSLAAESLLEGYNPLTERERGVLREAESGEPIAVIARKLSLSTGTVRNHVSSAIAKTNSVNRAQAVAEARRRGWL